MHTQRLPFATLVILMASLMAVGCATITDVDTPSAPMTVHMAQKSIVQSLSNLTSLAAVLEAKCTRQTLTFKAVHTYENGRTFDYTIKFADLRNLCIYSLRSTGSLVCTDRNAHRKNVLPGATYTGWFRNRESAQMFVDCLLTLRDAPPDTEGADFAEFSAAAKAWLAAESRPPMSDEARTSKAMAEDAFKRKDFAGALQAYLEGLGKHPMWPEGHYNAALLAAEIEDYEVAARHMRRYLALAPDAKDASAAKDKFLLWQRKAKE